MWTGFPVRTWWSGGRGRVTCVDTLSLLLSPEQLHSSSGGLSALLRGPSTVAAEGQPCVTLSLPAGIRIQNSNMVAKLLCSHCNTQLICNIYGPSHSPACYFSTTLCKRAQTDTLCSFYIVYISISVSLNTDWYFYSSRTLSRGWAGHLMLLL